MGKLENKVALITGGARGQGRSHALRLASEGAHIVACDIAESIPSLVYELGSASDLDETVSLVRALGGRIVGIKADVRDATQMAAVVEQGEAECGPIDIVVANAGICHTGRSWELTDEEWDDIVSVNLKGVWQTTKAVLPRMIHRGRGGAIVVTGSASGFMGIPNMAHYNAAKWGVRGLVQTLANECAPYGIRVNSIAPTAVATPMALNDAMIRLFSGRDEATIDDALPAYLSMNVLQVPWIEPEDVSEAVLYLVSDAARYVTGTDLRVDAGTCIQPPGMPPSTYASASIESLEANDPAPLA